MSRIGKKPIPLPDKVKVDIGADSVVVTGPKGSVTNVIPPGIRWEKKKKTASMAVMHEADYIVSCQAMLDDMEFTIVHELVHLELASLPKSEASRSIEEFAVNRITDALLARGR